MGKIELEFKDGIKCLVDKETGKFVDLRFTNDGRVDMDAYNDNEKELLLEFAKKMDEPNKSDSIETVPDDLNETDKTLDNTESKQEEVKEDTPVKVEEYHENLGLKAMAYGVLGFAAIITASILLKGCNTEKVSEVKNSVSSTKKEIPEAPIEEMPTIKVQSRYTEITEANLQIAADEVFREYDKYANELGIEYRVSPDEAMIYVAALNIEHLAATNQELFHQIFSSVEPQEVDSVVNRVTDLNGDISNKNYIENNKVASPSLALGAIDPTDRAELQKYDEMVNGALQIGLSDKTEEEKITEIVNRLNGYIDKHDAQSTLSVGAELIENLTQPAKLGFNADFNKYLKGEDPYSIKVAGGINRISVPEVKGDFNNFIEKGCLQNDSLKK